MIFEMGVIDGQKRDDSDGWKRAGFAGGAGEGEVGRAKTERGGSFIGDMLPAVCAAVAAVCSSRCPQEGDG